MKMQKLLRIVFKIIECQGKDDSNKASMGPLLDTGTCVAALITAMKLAPATGCRAMLVS